jgi:putative SOS response-associated peptidase YedK
MQRVFRFAGPLPNLPPRYNVAPTQQVPIVRASRGDRHDRELATVRWGLIPFWAKAPASEGSRSSLCQRRRCKQSFPSCGVCESGQCANDRRRLAGSAL